MIQIILTIVALIIYDIIKKGTKILILKWNKKKLDLIIKGVANYQKIPEEGQDYWGDEWI